MKRHLLWLVPLLCFVAMGAAFFAQEQKIRAVQSQKIYYENELRQKQNEADRIKRMIEYAKTHEYQLEYAREILGFVMPGDIKFNID